MSDNNSKKHHFLPRSILKNFTNQDNVIYVYDKKIGKMHQTSIANVGAENQYNTVKIGGEVYNLEEMFNDYDGKLASVINRIISNGNIVNEQHEFLRYAILVQLQRSPIQRSSYVSIARSIKEKIKNIISQSDFPLYEIDENQAKILSLLSITEIKDDLLDVINHRKIILLKDIGNKLITSDNAVIMHSISNYELASLKSPYTEVDFPISSEFSLSLVPDKVVEGIEKNLDNYDTLSSLKKSIHTGCNFSISEEYRNLLNSLQVLRSKRFIYSNYDCRDFITEILERNPKAANRDTLLTLEPQKNRNISNEKHIAIWIGTDYQVCELVEYNNEGWLDLDFAIPSKYSNLNIFNRFITKVSIFDQQYEIVMMRSVNIAIVSTENDIIYCHATHV